VLATCRCGRLVLLSLGLALVLSLALALLLDRQKTSSARILAFYVRTLLCRPSLCPCTAASSQLKGSSSDERQSETQSDSTLSWTSPFLRVERTQWAAAPFGSN